MNVPAVADKNEIMEAVLIKGDLSKLTTEERNRYYMETCQSLGLNPLTKPFDYITLNGKMTLYAKRDCADQLRKLNGVNIEIVDKTIEGQLFLVTVRATDRTGRQDEDMGAVMLPQGGSGEIRANAMLKAITKAKRRVTLSICGLGFLDETELEGAKKRRDGDVRVIRSGPIEPKPTIVVPEEAIVDAETDEVELSLEDMAREAAMRGREVLRLFLQGRMKAERDQLKPIYPELEGLIPTDAEAP